MNERTKNSYRRVIRVLMVVVAGCLFVLALGIPVANNFIAYGVEKELKALTLPRNTHLIDSVSVAGKVYGSGNGMQYFGALLIRSELPLDELETYYTALSADDDRLTARYQVEAQTGQEITVTDQGGGAFTQPVEGDGYYIVYTVRNVTGFWSGWLNLDMRGH